jgi:hypothetical protein
MNHAADLRRTIELAHRRLSLVSGEESARKPAADG